MIEQIDYRLAFILPQARQILASEASGIIALPSIGISRWNRPAEQLTRLIRSTWNIQAIVLDLLPGSSVSSPCAVIEVLTPDWSYADKGFSAVDPNDIESAWLSDEERLHLMSTLEDGGALPPFSRLGWVDEAQRWIQASVCDHAVEFSGEIVQLNAGGDFALVRFGTQQDPAYWLKATGNPNRQEFNITSALSHGLPQYLPPLVGTREDWNAWVMEEVGRPLSECLSFQALEMAILALAALQRQSILHIHSLLGAGSIDRRPAALQTELDELISFLAEAMNRQTSTKVQRLERHQLCELRVMLENAYLRIHDLDMPDCLIHGDINPGNILLGATRCVFIDWNEAYIGNPFVTFEHLWSHVVATNQWAEASAPHFRSLYKRQWVDLLSESKIDQAFAIAPLMAIAAELHGRGDWLRSSRRFDFHFQGYARSLARQMDRAARSPQVREALWRSM
jgi:Phosphotransferase enzyme family